MTFPPQKKLKNVKSGDLGTRAPSSHPQSGNFSFIAARTKLRKRGGAPSYWKTSTFPSHSFVKATFSSISWDMVRASEEKRKLYLQLRLIIPITVALRRILMWKFTNINSISVSTLLTLFHSVVYKAYEDIALWNTKHVLYNVINGMKGMDHVFPKWSFPESFILTHISSSLFPIDERAN